MNTTFKYQEIIDKITELLLGKYIFLDVAEKMCALLKENLPLYSAIDDGEALAKCLTDDLRSISRDKHLHVDFRPTEAAMLLAETPDSPPKTEFWVKRLAADNYGFYRVEWLNGGIGYMDLRGFAPPELGGDVAVAAMNFLANAKAIIFDLRKNGGGSPNMVQLLTTYLYDGDIKHLNTFYFRFSEEYTHFWTLPYVPGKRLPNADVYVLTSAYTFSGGEEFAYNLKTMERATLIGETTGGGANPGDTFAVSEHFTMFVPGGRAINPITQTNWEGTGVTPHIETPAEKALQVAHQKALEKLIERSQDEAEKQMLLAELEKVRAD